MLKSKIHSNWYLWYFLIVLCSIGIVISIVKAIIKISSEANKSFYPVIILFLVVLSFLFVIKDFKYIIIDKQKNNLRYYSALRPFGVMLELDYFDSKIKTSETSIRGQYDVVYLVKDGYTMFKISGLFYENFKEIDSCIKLKRISSFKFNFKLYLKLLFTGKIKIEE